MRESLLVDVDHAVFLRVTLPEERRENPLVMMVDAVVVDYRRAPAAARHPDERRQRGRGVVFAATCTRRRLTHPGVEEAGDLDSVSLQQRVARHGHGAAGVEHHDALEVNELRAGRPDQSPLAGRC